MITRDDLSLLQTAAKQAGIEVNTNDLQIIYYNPGNHNIESLPEGFYAVYAFFHADTCLKVGKVSSGSNPRYKYQHYSINGNGSTLARSLSNSAEYMAVIQNQDVGEWMRDNLTRYTILIPEQYGKFFLHFSEAFFILKKMPIFENGR